MADASVWSRSVAVPLRLQPWLQTQRVMEGTEWAWVSLALIEVFVAHMLFGANRTDLALGLAGLQALVLIWSLAFPFARRALAVTPILLPALLFAAVLAIGIYSLIPLGAPRRFELFPWLESPTGSLYPWASLVETVKLAGLGCIFLQGVILGSSRARGLLFLKLLVVGSAVYAAVGIGGFALSSDTLFGSARLYHADRLAGSFLSANAAADVIGMALIVGVGLLGVDRSGRRSAGRRTDLVLGGSILVLTTALFLTGSRGALAAAAVALAVVAVARVLTLSRGRTQKAFGLVLLCAFLGIAALAIATPMGERLSLVLGDVSARSAILGSHAPAIRAEFLQGYGAGTFARVNEMIQTPANIDRIWSVRALHNVYLQWIEERGLIGALAMWSALIVIFFRTAFARGRMSRDRIAILGVSVMILVHGLVDYGLEVPSVAAQWAILLGIGYAAGKPPKRRARPARGYRRSRFPVVPVGLAVGLGMFTALGAGLALASSDGRAITSINRTSAPPDPGQMVEAAPSDAMAWLRVAIVENDREGACGPDCINAVSNSYRAAPLARTIFAWRARFALEHWDQMPPSIRQKTLDHMTIEWKTRPGRRDVQGLAAVVHNPSGRLAVNLVLADLRAQDRASVANFVRSRP